MLSKQLEKIMNKISEFFLICSGANQTILKKCPSEYTKYVGIGATIFFTGLLASISAGYAIYTFSESVFTALGFGLIWGLMIFNLDRFVVSSMKKKNDKFQEFKTASPRLILAILLAIVISKPLELKIFEKEIKVQIEEKKNKLLIESNNSVSKRFQDIEKLEAEKLSLKNEIDKKEEIKNAKEKEYDFERFGKKTNGTSGISGIGKNAKFKERQFINADNEYQRINVVNNQKILAIENKLNVLNKQKADVIDLKNPTINNYNGLAARIDALGELSEKSTSMNLANFFIILLFIAVETSPLFVKLISEKGPYDDLLEKHEHSIENYKIEAMSKLNQKTNERLQLIIESGNNAVREEIDGNRGLMKRIVEAETELAQELINQWKYDEMKKIKSGGNFKGNTD